MPRGKYNRKKKIATVRRVGKLHAINKVFLIEAKKLVDALGLPGDLISIDYDVTGAKPMVTVRTTQIMWSPGNDVDNSNVDITVRDV